MNQILMVTGVVLAITGFLLIRFLVARSRAMRTSQPVELFGGLLCIVTWTVKQSIMLLRNQRVRRVCKGDAEGGGWAVICPLIGDHFRGPVSLGGMLTRFRRKGVLTCESIPVKVVLTIEWRISDPATYLLECNDDERTVVEQDVEVMSQQEHFRGAVFAQSRLIVWTSEIVRRLISSTSMVWLISSDAASSLNTESQDGTEQVVNSSNISRLLLRELAAKAAQANLGIEMVDAQVEEVELPKDVQSSINTARSALHKGQATTTELDALSSRLGVSTVQLMKLLEANPLSGLIGGQGVMNAVMGSGMPVIVQPALPTPVNPVNPIPLKISPPAASKATSKKKLKGPPLP